MNANFIRMLCPSQIFQGLTRMESVNTLIEENYAKYQSSFVIRYMLIINGLHDQAKSGIRLVKTLAFLFIK